MQRPKIVVVGSLNVDHTLRVPRIPAPGETLSASGMLTCFGGKGANQAVAAARAGGAVCMIGCVGQDDFGTRYVEYLHSEGIDTTGIIRSAAPTGSAFIAVDDRGENSIIVNAGANHAITLKDIENQAELIRGADAVLLQLECPLPVVRRAAEIAREAGVRVILNPSPLSAGYLSARFEVDVLIVNEGEAEQITPNQNLQEARCRHLLITRGEESTLSITAHGVVETAPPKVTPVDTVGAGDSFAGAFAVASSEGRADAIRFANAAGALATLKAGAQPAIPARAEIESFMPPSA
ncbi:ribokinase [Prosthecobacter sp.]|uniref:ribokinase n=1 Tax=Prosthecobacter sp. TaxID=1965333 RepID=UPI0037836C64